ncbi:MAG: type II secretion system major pseudopilin GspG [Fimbriimonadaceae bacterium]|nr:type II secretion system major pseudopilin GspG [Fimbriimonadaceae bacterium]
MMINLRPRHGRKAFTLIELLVVITILAVLAAMILPRLIGRAEDAKVAKALADLSELNKELQTFRLDNGRFPTTDEGLNALWEQPADLTGWKGPYSQKPVTNDPWGNAYHYEWPGSGGDDSFVLLSYGSDGQTGGDGYAEDLVESE